MKELKIMKNVVNRALVTEKTNILTNNTIMKNVIKYLCAILMVIGTNANAWGMTVTLTYDYDSDYNDMWYGDMTDASSYWKVTGTALFSVPISTQPTSNITINIKMAYEGSGTEGLEKISASGTESSSNWTMGETSACSHSGSTYSTCTFTITKPGSPTTLGGLDITLNRKYGKNLRVQKIEVSYTAADESTIVVKEGSSPISSINFGTVTADNGSKTINLSGSCLTYDASGNYFYASISGTDAEYFTAAAATGGAVDDSPKNISVTYEDLTEARTYSATLTITAYKDAECGIYDGEEFSRDIPLSVTFDPPCTTRTISMSNFSKDFGAADFVPTHTVSAGSGAKTWTSGTVSVATIVDGKVHIVGAGTSLITLNVAASGDYCAVSKSCTMTVNAVAPTVTDFTASCTNNKITVTNANASTVSNKGGKAITRYGYLYSTSVSTPTFGASGVSDAYVGTTDVTKDAKWAAKDITGLSAGTTYYVRAYAYNGSVYGYSSVVTVTTKCAVTYAGNGGTGTVTDASSPYAKGSDVTVLANGFTAPDGKKFVDWLGSNSTHYAPGATISSISTDITLTAQWTDVTYSDYKFSCAELTLTKAGVDTMFITSTASKSVRSQEAFHLTGSGLTPSTEFTFSFGNSDLNDRFAFKLADGSNVATNGSGAIDADIYVVYTPASGDGSDGLNIATNLTVTMSGAKPKSATLNTKTIIGRHLPEKFVIAAKKNGKWYALPSNMAASTPSPVEIAVDDSDNPTIAYTATDNMYSLYDQSAGEYIKLAMKGQSDAPLFGSTSTAPIGKSGDAIITNTLGNGYLWKLVQSRATGLTNAKEAKYTIYCKNNSTNHLRLKDDAGNPKWGLYDAGIDELRLITASNATVAEAYFIEYSTNGGVIEVDAGAISATKVLARFNGQTSGKIDLVQTCTSVKNRASAYNYTVTFNGGVNFAAKDAAGKILMLEWYNSSNELVGVTSIEMPRIIASSTTMSGYDTSHGSDNKGYWSGSEVHILPDVTLTGNLGSFSSGGEIKELHIYPGATFKITTGAATRTMHVGTLVLRNGWSRAGSKRYDVARVHIATTANLTHTNAYADWYIDYDQYYPMAVPWDVTVSGISYRYTSLAATVGHDKNIRLRYYDGALRVNGGNGTGTNWRLYGEAGAESVPTTLKPSQGYAITAKRPAGKAFAILRMPLTFADTWTTGGEQGRYGVEVKDTVHVIAHGVGANPAKPWYAVGWNFIGNPYMSCFDSNESDFMNKLIAENGGSVKYATIPDTEFEGFDQVNIASVGNKLKPSSGFFVQVGSTGSLRFKQGQIITPSAPARYTNEQEAIPEQEAFILLNGEQGHDQMGLVIGSDYTEDYEMNADLSKMLGNANIVKTWMRYTDLDMAYVAINEQLAREWIPVTVHIPAEGEYIYSLTNSSTVDELEGLYLIDYETGAITNLIYDEYIFTAEAGTRADRFAINAIVGERKVPTGADITGVDKNGNEPVKFIWHDKVYILHNSVIYDATGKCVNVINK